MEENPRLSFAACWWRALLAIFFVRLMVGFANGGYDGMIDAVGHAFIVAPLGALIAGFVYWLFKG